MTGDACYLRRSLDNFHLPTSKGRVIFDSGLHVDTQTDRCRLRLRNSATDLLYPLDIEELPVNAIVIVDGAFLLRREWRDQWDFAIWLKIGSETMIERAAKRDVAWIGSEQRVRERYKSFWLPTHRRYESMGPREAAHAVIDNEDPPAPRLVDLRLNSVAP